MDGIEGRLANEVSRSGEFYSSDECLQEAEQCEEVVSQMVHETRYDARISAIRRVETREKVLPTKRRGGRNPQGGPRDNGANRFPYMRTRYLGCGEEGHRAIGSPERPAQQLRSSSLPQNVVICHINPSDSKFIDPFISWTATTWLLYTEAFVSIIRKKLVKELNLSIHRGSTSIITYISGNVLSKEGSVEVILLLPRESIEHDCLVCNDGLSFPRMDF
ncbi:hypothetical protein JTB14_035501 [Gonioctena quinquepunctata]|nr:hypothetical protein JTB14_035501 [Gonioctena quinquepunctata]